jgi:hypothetical protein
VISNLENVANQSGVSTMEFATSVFAPESFDSQILLCFTLICGVLYTGCTNTLSLYEIL